MRTALIFCLLLASCAAHREQNYVRRCSHAGFEQGTTQHAECIDNLKMESAYGPALRKR